ncbi:DnaJ-domain-containing protein [Byssothecium circinans]|uniref:DnaJ-domain-containing protein n=1 Tax=Byssothecium circinans TaxID=147558 RepID=A0A6A5U9C7_9PLEO|nr:DnaJ-domain-containing protein [Byssothecium circinans]
MVRSTVQTHYTILELQSSCTLEEIKRAYKKIQLRHHPDKTGALPPGERVASETISKAAYVAYEVLTDARTRCEYDKSLQNSSSKPSRKQQRADSPASASDANKNTSSNPNADSDDEIPVSVEAQYRYMLTCTGTVIDISISTWRLSLNLSAKFRFLNDVTERSNSQEGFETISFEMGIDRDRSSYEYRQQTLNELTIKVASFPSHLRITGLKTLFRGCWTRTPTLTLTIYTSPRTIPTSPAPGNWDFGFDFDLSTRVHAPYCGTCMVFGMEEPLDYMSTYVGHDSPDCELKRDGVVKAEVFADMDGERVMKIVYGGVVLWRVAAVGYRLR